MTPDTAQRHRWWQYPRTKDRPHYNPWYIIGWRVLWAGPVFVSLCLLVAFASIGWGYREGVRVWRDVT